MAHSGKTMTFATNLLPQKDNVYNLGDSSQRWKINGITPGNARVFYGTCDTAAGTVLKEVICAQYDKVLTIGDMFIVKFSITNTGAVGSLQLTIKNSTEDTAGTTAKNIKRQYNGTGANNLVSTAELNKDSISVFVYNGTYWILTNADYNNTYSYMRPYENTAKGSYSSINLNPAKTAAAGWKFQLSAGKYFMYTHYYDNQAQSALTLNIGSTGAKPIYINGEASSSSNYTLPGGQYLVYYDGTNYHFRTDDKMSGNISGNAVTASSVALSGVTGADDLKAIEALSGTSGFLKKTAANTWILDTPVLTNVSFTAATDNNEYPILLKNSTGSDTTAAGVKFANTTNKMTTINPSTGMITAPSLTLASNAAIAHLAFARAGWNYVTMPNNDSSVISIGYGTQADNTTQRLVIYKTGTVRPGANGSQNLGDDTHKWNKVYGVNFYGTFNGTATSAQQLAAREIDNSDLNQFSSGGALKYAWAGGDNGIDSKPTNVNAFGVIAMKTAASWTGQLLMSTDTEPGLYWRTNLTTETPSYGSWTPLASGNGGVYYGTCETAADVVEKVVVCKHYHTLKAGDIIVVTFTNSNTQAQPKLNVNNTGAVAVKMAYSGGIVDLGSTSQLRFTCTFIYDGTYWLIINQQNAIQLATSSGNVNWRSVLLSDSNSVSENFTPSANTLGRTYAAHNVKYQPSTGTLRAPIMKTPKVQIEYDHVNKAHIQWNDTDSSIDFIFD